MRDRVVYGEPDSPRPGSKAPDYGGAIFPSLSSFVFLTLLMFVVFLPGWM